MAAGYLVENGGVSVIISKTGEIRGRMNVNYKVVEHHRFSTKRHLMVMNATNRTLKMHICLFASSETVTSRNLNERRKDYLSDEKRAPNVVQWYRL
ncbi:hypothetical protein AVEN_24960-1 [Araneus ventricosus]|uniref:Uncharacterized protein n=1 Tax=Araneus ventricosus TaxID=182803 RepID=A0A4Y2G5A4_ARAVE|nr:hypothetical protein AVEN_24960-1 [Araneus ventricosus]